MNEKEIEVLRMALRRLSSALGNPALEANDDETLESALVDHAVFVIGVLQHEVKTLHDAMSGPQPAI